jgi:hypothetical protein
LNRRGQTIVYAVVLMPTLFLILALALDIGALQLDRLRLRQALDLATVSAATAVDGKVYTATGRLQFDGEAAIGLTREYLSRNLAGLPGVSDADQLAALAEVRVVNQLPARDPFSGRTLGRPTICARLHAPHEFNLLTWVGIRRMEITVSASSEIRR